MTPTRITFPVEGDTCAGLHYTGDRDAADATTGRPCVVMGHGFGATMDCGLDGFARRFAAAGLDVLTFDYRGFGTSGGEPRQTVSIRGQQADFAAAIGTARRLPGVDAGRIVLWGVSLAGGHVLVGGARASGIAAVIALVPFVDGLAATRHAWRQHTAGQLLRSTVTTLGGSVARLVRRREPLLPIAGEPGQRAALTLPGNRTAYQSIAGPTWRNEINARAALQTVRYRPARYAGQVRCPLLVQVADLDRTSPPRAAARAAEAGRAEVRHYPCDHFDVLPGQPWHEIAVEHQLAFLRRRLGAADSHDRKQAQL
ncbi:Fermentation-respiration switch protein FrsA, has esterase activity, DUF1100 family [Amycolatopsis marina]|uniref:Fermentation-respiration switch protein FrsA, has esterase activity, DUF1100 family n=1 Tax=Amycolatopsis marina TaxID=490629 RepID=A0A1I1ATT5_9PSEU|nr:alpha/beta hydrolase [Amycolatopsis marina]SFB41485.1 Fermentation-respiration switch protein FrsA, has esterase activity, DUF1100 family [Amycolatopsis marina]